MTAASTHARRDIGEVLTPVARPWWARWSRWLVGVSLAVGLISAAVMMARSKASAETPAYVTETVTRGDLDVHVSATGKLEPTNTVEVGSELSGLIETVFVDENESVKKGQVLARLDTSKLRDQLAKSAAAVTSAQAKLTQASATVKEATANLRRLREVLRLSGGKVPSLNELEKAEATLARAEGERTSATAAVAEAEAALNFDRTNLAKASIRSPIDGIVLKRTVEPGQTVAAALQVATLFTIAEDLQQMELKVDVDEADVGQVRDGQRATFTVDAYPTRMYKAEVVRVAYGSTTTGDVVSYAAALKVQNDDLSLRPGMTASAEVASASVKGAVLVPNAALRFTPAPTTTGTDRGGFIESLIPHPPRAASRQAETTVTNGVKQVWVLQDGVPVAVPVTVGLTDGRLTEIIAGDLREGTQVITELKGAQP